MLAMGEVVLLSAVYKVIKKNLPKSTLSVIASKYACDFLKSISWIDEVIPIESFGIDINEVSKLKRLLHRPFIVPSLKKYLNKGNFDCVFVRNEERLPYTQLINIALEKSNANEVVSLKPLMQKHFDPSVHVVKSYLSILKEIGFKVGGDERPTITPTVDDSLEMEHLLERMGVTKKIHKIVGIKPDSNLKIKGWSVENTSFVWKKLARDTGIKIILFSADREYINNVSALVQEKPLTIGHLPFDKLIAFIAQCNLFISVDTGLMHVATALGIPTIGIFGPTSGKMFGPYGANCYTLQGSMDCPHYRPESLLFPEKGDFQQCYTEDTCLLIESTCVNRVLPESVFRKARELLENGNI